MPRDGTTCARTTKIQILSDLHLEHGGSLPAHHPEADVIVLAGDLAPYTEGLVECVRERWSSAPHIVYVLGNHELYGTEIDETRARLTEECASAGIHLLDPDMVRIEGIRFIDATLRPDLILEGMSDEIGAHLRVGRGVADFCGAIRHRGRPFATGESVRRHRADRSYIERELERARRADDQAVVVTDPISRCRSDTTSDGQNLRRSVQPPSSPRSSERASLCLRPTPVCRNFVLRFRFVMPHSPRIVDSSERRVRAGSGPCSQTIPSPSPSHTYRYAGCDWWPSLSEIR